MGDGRDGAGVATAMRDGKAAAKKGAPGVCQACPLKVSPLIDAAKDIVVVKKDHTSPKRRMVTLKADMQGATIGTLTRSSDHVKLFTQETKGEEIKFDGNDNVFPGGKLASGVKLWASGGSAGDSTLTLTLTKGSKDVNPPVSTKITALDVTLQIFSKAGAQLSEKDKIRPGRPIHVQDKSGKRLRAKMKITINPSTYAGVVNLKPLDDKLQAFAATAGGVALKTPYAVKNSEVLYAEGSKISGVLADTGFKLDVDGLEPDADHVHITVVKAQLEICKSRTAADKDPDPIAEDKKTALGRFVHAQAGGHHGRAMLIVSPVQPKDFEGKLVLSPVDAKVSLFEGEKGGVALVAAVEIAHDSKFPVKGERRWVEGTTVSGALRDTGVKLGIKDVEDECDQVAITVVRLKNLRADIPSTPPHTLRAAPIANGPVARFTVDHATGALNAADYDIDFGTNLPVVLLQNSLQAADPLVLTVQVEPAGVDVSWAVQRDRRPDPHGDHDDVIKLSPKDVPSIKRDDGNHLRATLTANAVGSFHVCAFVDCDGKGFQEFDDSKGKRIDREPFIPINLVLVYVRLKKNDCEAHQTMAPAHAADGLGGVGVSMGAGDFDATHPENQAVHMKTTVDVIGGGRDGTLGLDSVFAGWCNNEAAAEDISATYANPAPPPPTRRRFTLWASNNTAAHNIGSAANPVWEFRPGDPAPNIIPPPVLDSGRPGPGIGGDTCCLTSSNISSNTPLAIGQRWVVEAIDSPGDGAPSVHPAFPGALLARFRFHLEFMCTLAFWTNIGHTSGATADPANRLYAVFGQVDWSMNGEWTINQIAGTRAEVTAPKVKMNKHGFKALQAGADTSTEFRPPTGLNTMAADARA
jgi:hypothetical protein